MLKSLLLFFRKLFTTKAQLMLENLFLAKQLEIYQRTDPKLKIKRTDHCPSSKLRPCEKQLNFE